MEAMDICLATTKEISYLIINHPVYSAFGAFICFPCLLIFYCRLTLGVYDGDQDLTGKTVLITGASAGIGKAAACDFARRNARVLLGCRNPIKAEKVAREIRAATGNDNVLVKQLDLSSFESVRECAKSVLKTEEKLHILVNNAGMADVKKGSFLLTLRQMLVIGQKRKLTVDGCETVMQTNHFGHFLLTLLLLDLLKKSAPSRIINVSSEAYKLSNFDLEDLTNEKNTRGVIVYANSKLCNILFTRELSRRLSGTGVTVNALHPGCVKTNIINNPEGLFGLMTVLLFTIVGKTAEEGAQTTIRLAVDPELENTSGKFFMDCKEKTLNGKANDMKLAKSLFEISEKIVGVSFLQT